MSDPVIKINSSKPTEIDFEVSVQTNCADDKPCVRFAVELEEEKHWLSLVCVRDEETKKWIVTIPALKSLVEREEYPFILEVIVEDYYFVPAKGVLQPVQTPVVEMTTQKKKPSVAASFNNTEEPLQERDPGAGTAHGSYDAPTNKLLKPEHAPKQTHVEEPDEEDRDIEEVIGAPVTPGDTGMTADNRKQPDGKSDFDAREVARRIVKETINVKKPAGKGYLFNRVDEKAVVKGLEPQEVKITLAEKAQKVKKILDED